MQPDPLEEGEQIGTLKMHGAVNELYSPIDACISISIFINIVYVS